jgi:phage terminase small subunit
MPPLNNNRHERFVQLLFQGESATDAHAGAGYRRDDGNAARLRQNPNVQARLAELQAEVAKQTTVTVEGLINERRTLPTTAGPSKGLAGRRPRPDIVHSSLYLPEPVYEALRESAYKERCKIHDIIMRGIDAALKKRGYPSIDDFKLGRKR